MNSELGRFLRTDPQNTEKWRTLAFLIKKYYFFLEKVFILQGSAADQATSLTNL